MSCLAKDFRFCLLIGVEGFGILKGKGGKKKTWCGKLRGGGGRTKSTGLLSGTEPKLGFSGCYSRRERLGSLRRENGVVLEK